MTATTDNHELRALVQKWREALQEIISAHANDNVRPRAFYIAADALAALQQKGSGNG